MDNEVFIKNRLSNAIEVLTEALRTDKDYYNAWQANIAMSVFDKVPKESILSQDIHKACNEGAKAFLDLLISQK